jgi:TonB-linked SusC/RagA family outer membrane protein
LALACIYPVYAQNANVSILKSPIRIAELIAQIESQTDYLFVYSKRTVDVRRTVVVGAERKSVAAILEETFRGTGIRYIMEGNHIVLTGSKEESHRKHTLTVEGIVTDTKGDPVAGANVVEQGTDAGTITDAGGRFRINMTGGGNTLDVSYVGYKAQTVPVDGRTQLTVRMEEEAQAIEAVVVTAMGIAKKEASLTCSTQRIESNELVRAKDPHMINTLSGKVSGVQINRSSSGPGGSVKVSIRGSRSVNGNNQPLYVVDGMPILNSATEQVFTILGGVADSGNRDGSDGISNLNPEDIESIHILKGASAAALYGSQAANGVIMVTTRKGRDGFKRITLSSSLTFDRPATLPKLQNSYGTDANKTSWGEKAALKDDKNAERFFRRGRNAIHALTLTAGNETIQTYFSYGNTRGEGIIKGNSLNRHNLNVHQTATLFSGRLKLDGNLNLIRQTIRNRPVTGGYYLNPLVGLYGFPRGESMERYRTDFETYDPERRMNVQSWHTRITGLEQNPYWLIRRVLSDDKRYRTIAGLSATLKINPQISIQARGTADYISDNFKQKMYASTAADLAGIYYPDGSGTGYPNGRYIHQNRSELLLYGDVMALADYARGRWTANGAIGASINHTSVNSLYLDSRTASLYYPNVFTVSNIVMNTNAHIDESIDKRREIQSLLATAQLGWNKRIYIDLTARNDWSSTLAGTQNRSYFYSSAGLSWIISNTLQMPPWVSSGKAGASWAQVGNDLPPFYSKPEDHIMAGGAIQGNDRAPFDVLKPELSISIELGTEWKLFNRRLELSLAFYKTNTRNQLLTLPSSAGAKYKYYMVNAGNIENKGLEATVNAIPAIHAPFSWETGITFSAHKNKIVKLHPSLNSFIYGDEGFSMSYAMRLKEGGSFGDIYGWKFDRNADGTLKLNAKGLPLTTGSGNTEKTGNCNPRCMMGWSNELTCKGIVLYILIDARIGGDVFSQTQAELDYRGVSANTAEARGKGYVEIKGQRFTDVESFYKHAGTRNGTITEYYMYSATNIRLRELSLGYTLPKSLLERTKLSGAIDLSLTARNLFFFHKAAPFDPDTVMSTGNSCLGVDVFGLPATRSIGFNIKFTF